MGKKSQTLEAEMRLGGGPAMPEGFVSLDELANNIRQVSRAVDSLLNNGPLTRKAVEVLLLEALPTPSGREKKIGRKQLRAVLDTLAQLKDLYVLDDGEDPGIL